MCFGHPEGRLRVTELGWVLGLTHESAIRDGQHDFVQGRVADDCHWEVDVCDLERLLAECSRGQPA